MEIKKKERRRKQGEYKSCGEQKKGECKSKGTERKEKKERVLTPLSFTSDWRLICPDCNLP